MTDRAAADDEWAGERVARWLRQAPGLERQMEQVSERLFVAARIRPGETVLDVGCGTGPTTREAARAVGPTGRVTGVDISDEMLAAAASHPEEAAAAPIEWVVADAVAWPASPEGAYDLVISRFGVMFFSDPAAAFARLAGAARPGGRLAMAVWSRRDESELFELPLQVAVRALRGRGTEPAVPPLDAGPFSLHDPAELSALLGRAGWRDVQVAPVDLFVPFGGGAPPHEAASAALDFGPTRLVTTGLSERDLAEVQRALATAFAEHVDADGHVTLQCRIHVVTARRG